MRVAETRRRIVRNKTGSLEHEVERDRGKDVDVLRRGEPFPPPLYVFREPAPAVGRLQEQRSAALQLRPHGGQERFRLGKVLDHVEEHDRVERSLVRHDRERFEPHVDPVTCVRLLGRAAVELRADHVPAIIAERRQHCAIRRPDLQQTTAR